MITDKKWRYIAIASIIITIVWCSTILIVNRNPFEVSFKSDDNVVEITESFVEMTNNMEKMQSQKIECETKLKLYTLEYGDKWENGNNKNTTN